MTLAVSVGARPSNPGMHALLERMGPEAYGAQERLEELAASRKEHSGVGWWMRLAVLRTSSTVGYLTPQR